MLTCSEHICRETMLPTAQPYADTSTAFAALTRVWLGCAPWCVRLICLAVW